MLLVGKLRQVVEKYFEEKLWDVGALMFLLIVGFFYQPRQDGSILPLQESGVQANI